MIYFCFCDCYYVGTRKNKTWWKKTFGIRSITYSIHIYLQMCIWTMFLSLHTLTQCKTKFKKNIYFFLPLSSLLHIYCFKFTYSWKTQLLPFWSSWHSMIKHFCVISFFQPFSHSSSKCNELRLFTVMWYFFNMFASGSPQWALNMQIHTC